MKRFLDWLFGCRHPRITFPMIPPGGKAGKSEYIVCLDCGKEFAYDWKEMKEACGKTQ